MRSLILLLSFSILLFSCGGKQSVQEGDFSLLDSLKERCYTLSVQLQVDSLRMVANEYIKASPKNSDRYFNARQYYINSYFNAREFDKVLSLLDETERMPHFYDYPHIVSNYMYMRARAYQYTQRYPEAIEVFKRCMTYTPLGSEQQKKTLPTVLQSMTQLLNTYMTSGKVEDGYYYFKQVKDSPPPIIKYFALRDLYAHLGYLASFTKYMEEAYCAIDSMLKQPVYEPTPEKLFAQYSFAAMVLSDHPDRKEQTIRLLNQALDEAAKYDYTAGVQWSMNLLAGQYRLLGKIEEGTELQYKALKMAQNRGDIAGESACYVNLSALYRDWEFFEQANEYANRALAIILPTDEYQFRGWALRAKADVMKELNQPDSAIYYYKKSIENSVRAQRLDDVNSQKILLAGVYIENCVGDSLADAVKLLKEIYQETGTNLDRSYYSYLLAKGLIKQGKLEEGESMLDSMCQQVARMKEGIYKDGVLEYTLDHYLSRKNETRIAQYASLYRNHMDKRFNEKISRKVTSAMIKFKTEEKEQQLKLVTAELQVKDLRIKLYVVALILLFFAITGAILWYFHKRKLQRNLQLLTEQEKLVALRDRELAEARLHEQEMQLVGALENLREANLQGEQLREQLDEFLADRENQQTILSVTPSLLREKGEIKFRRYFTQLYPAFLISLKERVPDVTRGEEILSMLIALNQNMDEVADILCVERKSVKMSRYRLRKKLDVVPETSLDEFIKSLL